MRLSPIVILQLAQNIFNFYPKTCFGIDKFGTGIKGLIQSKQTLHAKALRVMVRYYIDQITGQFSHITVIHKSNKKSALNLYRFKSRPYNSTGSLYGVYYYRTLEASMI